jgi:ankyrin repeat protein
LLLSVGAEVNGPASCEYGRTALRAAVKASMRGSDIELVQFLLNSGANIHGPAEDIWPGRLAQKSFPVKDRKRRRTPLQAAAKGNNTRLIRLLLERGANVNAPAPYNSGRTALQAAAAAKYGNTQVIEMLLEAGADVNAPAAHDYGVTALQGAAIRGFIGIATILLNAGADVNAPAAPYEGRTALEGAAEHGRLDMVQLLLNAGAGTNIPGNAGFERAIYLAEKNGYYAVAGLIKARLRD